jgi:hypothetical protein
LRWCSESDGGDAQFHLPARQEAEEGNLPLDGMEEAGLLIA